MTVIVQRVCPAYRVPFFRRLAAREPIVVVHGRGARHGALRNADAMDGFPRLRLRSIRLDLTALNPYLWISWFPSLFFHLVRIRPRSVVCGGVSDFPNSLSAVLYAALFGIPLVVWDSGRRIEKPMSRVRRLLEPASRFLLRRAAACIGYSAMAKRFFLAAGVPEQRIFLAPNTLDVDALLSDREELLRRGAREKLREELGIPREAVVLLYVGAMERRKRLETVVEAVTDLVREGRPVALILVGDGPLLEPVRRLVHEAPAPYLHLPGRVVAGVGRYFVAADLFVLPGPGGLSINQAMCYALPVVVRGGDGTEEDLVENGSTGYVVEGEQEMRARIRQLVLDGAARKQMGERALERIRAFDLERMCEGFRQALGFVLSSGVGHEEADRPRVGGGRC